MRNLDYIRLDPEDNVVTAIRPLEHGHAIEETLTRQMIPRGHKLASTAIPEGAAIKKYAQTIGYASTNIEAGDHVHNHNVEFRNTNADYEYSTDLRPIPPVKPNDCDTFMGYRRANGIVGTRKLYSHSDLGELLCYSCKKNCRSIRTGGT